MNMNMNMNMKLITAILVLFFSAQGITEEVERECEPEYDVFSEVINYCNEDGTWMSTKPIPREILKDWVLAPESENVEFDTLFYYPQVLLDFKETPWGVNLLGIMAEKALSHSERATDTYKSNGANITVRVMGFSPANWLGFGVFQESCRLTFKFMPPCFL